MVARKKIKEQRRIGERPSLPAIAARKHIAEEILGAFPAEKMFLIGRAFIGITGRNRDLDAIGLHIVEEPGQRGSIGPVKHSAIHLHAKSLGLGQRNRFLAGVINAILTDRFVMHGLIAIKMDRPSEEWRRCIVVDLLFEQERIGAQNHELLLRDIALHDFRHIAVEQRLAARNRDSRRAAIVNRLHTLLIA